MNSIGGGNHAEKYTCWLTDYEPSYKNVRVKSLFFEDKSGKWLTYRIFEITQ